MHRVRQTQAHPTESLCRRFVLSPVDALIDLVIGCRLRSQIPIWLDFDTTTDRRITVAPQRWPERWCDVLRLRLDPDVIEYLPDIGAVRDEGDDAHLPAADGAQEREHLIDAGNQYRPQE